MAIISGTSGSDILNGTPDADTISGDGGDDSLAGAGGDDTLDGGDGHDVLRGGAGNDTLLGGDGDDFLNGGPGDDIIDGGAGFDRATFFSGAVAGVHVDLNIHTAQDTGQGMDTLTGIENVSGTTFADMLIGDGGDNWVWGVGGDDILLGGGGNDLVQGGPGDVTADGGDGIDTFSVNDNGAGSPGATVALALQGAAQATGIGSMTLTGFENLSGSSGDDSLTGDTGANVLAGDGGNDMLSGGAGNDTLYGDGRIGIDSHDVGTSGPITTFADVAAIGEADGNDVLEGGLGDDALWGGGGTDTASYAHASGTVQVSLASGLAFGADGNDTLHDIENVTGSEFDDSLSGDGGANVLSGLGGNDLLNGRGGDDTLDGGAGDDLLRGGAGNDTLRGGDGDDNLRGNQGVDFFDGGSETGFENLTSSYGDRVSFYEVAATSGVVADLRTGVISNDGFGNVETMVNIESLGADTAFADTFYGNDGRNALLGNRGDSLYGFGGNDIIALSSAAAVADGGAGIDVLRLDTSGGWLTPDADSDGLAETAAAATAGWMVNLSAGTMVDGYGNSGSVTGIENVDGSALGDILIGDANANVLNGGSGSDRLDGGNGIDTASYADALGPIDLDLRAGLADEYDADGTTILSTDTLVNIENVIGSAHADTIVGSGGANVLDGRGGDDFMLGGAGDDTLYGGDGNDFLRGDLGENYTGPSGNDILYGGAGNDLLRGGLGDDRLYGGDGNDHLRGNEGVDYFDGGSDTGEDPGTGYGDRVSFFEVRATQGVVADLRTGIISNDGFGNVETMVGIESLGADTAYADTFYGNDGRNFLFGSRGDNLYGFGGNDVIALSSAAAVVDGGTGTDLLQLDAFGGWLMPDSDGDGVAEAAAAATAGWTVNLSAGSMVDGYGNSGSVTGIENVDGSTLGDILIGDVNANVLNGGDGDDTLEGGGGSDTLNGGGGNDLLDGGIGGDLMLGGAGDDVYIVDQAGNGSQPGDAVIENAGEGTDEIRTFIDWGLGGIPDVENLTALGTADIFLGGNDGDNVLTGNGGNNYFVGAGGNDTIDGGGGTNDTAAFYLPVGTAGVFSIVDGSGIDGGKLLVQITNGGVTQTFLKITITGQGSATVEGVGIGAFLGTDTVTNVERLDIAVPGSASQFVAVSLTPNQVGAFVGGSEGNDTIDLNSYPGAVNSDGGRGDDTIIGTSGVNFLGGGGGNDLIQAGAGNDSLAGGDGNDTLQGDAGNDSIGGGSGDDVLQGGDGDDYLMGEGGNDSIDGGGGTNDIAAFQLPVGTPGVFSIVDGSGTDGGKLLVQITNGGVTQTFLKVTITGQGSATVEGVGIGAFLGTDTVTNVERLDIAVPGSASQFVAIRLASSQGGTLITGSDGSDIIDLAVYPGAINANGGRGDDSITGTANNNNLSGGLGNDTLSGLSGDDGLVGADGDDILDGGDGHDALRGGPGNDTLLGGNGDDFLNGGPGDDIIDGGAGFDRAAYFTGATAGVHVDLNIHTAQNTGQGMDTLTNIENVSGTAFADTLIGDGGENWLSGSGGADTLLGGGGNDLVQGGPGDVTADGGDGIDTFSINTNGASSTGATVSLALQGAAQTTGLGSMVLSGFENLSGTGYADLLTGDDGDNILAGDQGEDTLVGGAGNDVLLGDGGFYTDTHGVGTSGPITLYEDMATLFGGPGYDDILDGGLGDDRLVGGGGNDRLIGGSGNDTLEGGSGTDTADYSGAAGNVTVNLSLGIASGADGNDTLQDIENVAGSAFDDTFTGNASDNKFDGGAGTDMVQFSGARSAYVVGVGPTGAVEISGAATGHDSFENVEIYRFDDGDYAWDAGLHDLALIHNGVVGDGYVSGATLYIDVNNNGRFDAGFEPSTLTDANGRYSLASNAVGALRAVGGTNVDTGLANLITLSAPLGSTVINPLTTLVEALVEAGSGQAAAEAQVKAAFGLDPNLQLSSFDILAAPQGDSAALQAQKAAASVVATLDAIISVGGTGPSAEAAGLASLAGAVAGVGVGQTLDLADTATLTAVVTAALPGADQGTVANLVATTQAVNQAIGASSDLGGIVVVQANHAPSASNDSSYVVEDHTISGDVRSNDTDPDAGDHLIISAVSFGASAGAVGSDLEGLYGTLRLQANGTYTYAADTDYLDTLHGVTGLKDVFTYTVSDGHGGISTATLTVNVSLAADERTITGGNSADIIHGDQRGVIGAEDTIYGGNGADQLYGEDGADTLFGGNDDDKLFGGQGRDSLYGDGGNDLLDGGAGNDRLEGGKGNDRLTGGSGADIFVFGKSNGADVITDFDVTVDHIQLIDGVTVKSFVFADVDHNGTLDLVMQLSSGSITLLNVAAPLHADVFI